MLLHTPLTDAERAGRALRHPLALILSDRTVAALAEISTRPVATPEERRLLRQVWHAIDAAELALGREVAQ
jgi:hypothetical protein